MSGTDRRAQLEAFVSDMLQVLWHRLYDAHCWTVGNEGAPRWDRDWSISAEGLADDIRRATELIGPVDLWSVGMEMLSSGWFAQAVDRIGLPSQPVPDEEFLAKIRDIQNKNS